MPALDGNWLNADELAAPETPGQSADDGLPCEAMLKPLPAPEPDLPLPLGILPAMAAADEDTSALTDKLAGMQRLITQVVGNTTGIDLRPAGSPEVGLTAIGFEFEKSPGQTGSVNRLAGALADLGLALRRAPVRLAIGATVRFEVPLRSEERRFVPILPLLREVQPAPDTDEVRLLLGRRHDGSPYELELTQARHILVGGSTGGGKTVLLHSMIFGLAFRYAPSAVRLALFDPKVFEFSRYKGLPHLWHEVVTTEEGYMCLVDNLADELERRKRARQADPMATFPALVTIIDEFRGFDCPKLIQIIAQARALRMYFVLATQHPTANVISTAIKANLTTGIALRVRDSTASRLIIGDQGAESLLPYGDCLVQGPDGLVRIQAGWVRDAPDTDLPRLQAHLEAPTERPDTPPDTRGESAGEPVDPIPAAAE
jgi:S-DNA-T family DNA segregation ATPase FtsK/SpoIIIE